MIGEPDAGNPHVRFDEVYKSQPEIVSTVDGIVGMEGIQRAVRQGRRAGVARDHARQGLSEESRRGPRRKSHYGDGLGEAGLGRGARSERTDQAWPVRFAYGRSQRLATPRSGDF